MADRDGAFEALRAYAPNLTRVVKVLCDGGYSGEKFAGAVRKLMEAEGEVIKRNEQHKFAVLPQALDS